MRHLHLKPIDATHLDVTRQLRHCQPPHNRPQQIPQHRADRTPRFAEQVHDQLANEDAARLGEGRGEEAVEKSDDGGDAVGAVIVAPEGSACDTATHRQGDTVIWNGAVRETTVHRVARKDSRGLSGMIRECQRTIGSACHSPFARPTSSGSSRAGPVSANNSISYSTPVATPRQTLFSPPPATSLRLASLELAPRAPQPTHLDHFRIIRRPQQPHHPLSHTRNEFLLERPAPAAEESVGELHRLSGYMHRLVRRG
jgi:hypothetical protein